MKALVSLALLSSAVAYADIHSDLMSNVQFRTQSTNIVESGTGNITVNYNGTRTDYNSRFFMERAQKSSDMMIDYLSSRGINDVSRCRTQSINVYDVESSILNTSDIYETVDWGDENRSSLYGSKMLGLFDNPAPGTGPVTIYTDIGLGYTDRIRIITHEMAHFWYDQLCLSRKGINSEQMAQDFENFYRENSRNPAYQRPYSR
tara:strand:- start:4156 stop:4767 length:612 start_codon:yes stop_codon:yes gene_type:complete